MVMEYRLLWGVGISTLVLSVGRRELLWTVTMSAWWSCGVGVAVGLRCCDLSYVERLQALRLKQRELMFVNRWANA